MKRITICISDESLKHARKVQAESQLEVDLSVSLSNVITSCINIAITKNKQAVINEIADGLAR
jgi:hypothetical protein